MNAGRAHDAVVQAAARGDDEALAQLVRAYHDRVYRFGKRACRDASAADDAVQDAFAALARRPEVVRGEGALPWLYTVVRNACLRLLRGLRRTHSRLGDRIDDPDTVAAAALDPEAALARWQLVERVHRAIAALDQPHREVLILRDLEGESGPEVCLALGISAAAMKSRLHRARALVRAQVTQVIRPAAP